MPVLKIATFSLILAYTGRPVYPTADEYIALEGAVSRLVATFGPVTSSYDELHDDETDILSCLYHLVDIHVQP
jgi:hypothetical protein